ncbi:MAG: FAD-dependent oxidoreductase [Flavobacteriaceae bacterium]|jgi:glycine/D-amino acid oxidase-like deaminating enzyme|nr:FAD-dependent oxidoreductase [Flavobacteriaceae bacterium]MCB0485347.1 FAD-dependent oxidoreductase [Flavobacteriaceae bacterium]
MKVDYIIVGLGLAGLAFAEKLLEEGKTFLVYEDASQNSSIVAAGAYNPVILKRFTPVWDAEDQLKLAKPFYDKLEKKLQQKLDYELTILRIFKSIEEQNDWFMACDKPFFSNYMIPKVIPNQNENVIAPFGSGRIKNIGKIDAKTLIDSYKSYLIAEDLLINETFDHFSIILNDNELIYKEVIAKRIVFCEGYGIKKNPFFNDVPVMGAKGELLTIYAPNLKVDEMLKSAVFVMPIGDDMYKVGATFNWTDKTITPTDAGKEELIEKLSKVITSEYKIIDHNAGVRPTTKDRRPILGKHKTHKQLAILNGLGTRGVLLAPKMAQKLFEHLENDQPLDKEITIDRFYG